MRTEWNRLTGLVGGSAWVRWLVLLLGSTASLAAQREAITADQIGEVLRFLASDELAGRDTPSVGQDKAAEYLAGRFRKAKLSPGVKDSFFHGYRRAGQRLDRTGVHVGWEVDGKQHVLQPGTDVRLWRAGGGIARGETEVLRLAVGARAAQALEFQTRGKKPVLLEVAEDSLLWQAFAAPNRLALEGRTSAGPPWLLVRQGVLPTELSSMVVGVPKAEPVELELRNVIAALPGSAQPDEWVVLSAHYDHIGIGLPAGEDAIYNGADDDATGTAAVVAIAEALVRAKPKLRRSVAFVCFSGEERGLIGSQAFVQAPPFALEQVVANVNLEMLGRPWKPNTVWVTGRDLSDFEAITAQAAQRAGIACEPFPQQAMLFEASDNISFARHGVVAHSISASELHADYHRPSDEVDGLDLENMTAVVRGLYEVVVDLATRPETPAYNQQGRQRLKLDK